MARDEVNIKQDVHGTNRNMCMSVDSNQSCYLLIFFSSVLRSLSYFRISSVLVIAIIIQKQ